MEKDRYCDNCKVYVSSDLSNCPLCGKHILKQNQELTENARTFPLYSFHAVQNIKWYNITRGMFWIIALICLFVNLIFPTKPYWFAYVLAGLVMIFHVFIEPLKVSVKDYIKELIIMSIIIALFLIFIDAYDHFTLSTKFGWSMGYASPFLIMASTIACTIICLCSSKFEHDLIKSVCFVALFSLIYFIVVMIWFKKLPVWPSLSLVCVCAFCVAVLELFKRNKLLKELKREFHL